MSKDRNVVRVEFRPLNRDTLKLVEETCRSCDDDLIIAYSRLISAAMIAGAMLDLSPDDVSHQVDKLMPNAKRSVEEWPYIFGETE